MEQTRLKSGLALVNTTVNTVKVTIPGSVLVLPWYAQPRLKRAKRDRGQARMLVLVVGLVSRLVWPRSHHGDGD